MLDHAVGTQEEWLAASKDLLAAEKEHSRRGDELARRRRELPWVPIHKEYAFETSAGTKALADLFAGRSQLLVYHFMFGSPFPAGWQEDRNSGGSCDGDHFDGVVPHLNGHGATLVADSSATRHDLQA